MDFDKKEKEWESMSLDEKLYAYAKVKYESAKARDSIKKFRKENNLGNLMYEMKTTFIYTI